MTEQDLIDVTSLTEENPDWVYVCLCGEILTLQNQPRAKFVKWEYFDYGERLPVLSYHCRKCWHRVPDDIVARRQRPSTHRVFLVGRLRND